MDFFCNLKKFCGSGSRIYDQKRKHLKKRTFLNVSEKSKNEKENEIKKEKKKPKIQFQFQNQIKIQILSQTIEITS